MKVLSWCWRGSRRQALRDLRKGLVSSSEGGNTGRRTDWPCHINSRNELLRPSVQLPAGIHGWRALYGFSAPWQGNRARKRGQEKEAGKGARKAAPPCVRFCAETT